MGKIESRFDGNRWRVFDPITSGGSDIGFSSCAVLVLCGPGLAQMPGLAVGFDGLRPGLDWQSILSKPKYCIK